MHYLRRYQTDMGKHKITASLGFLIILLSVCCSDDSATGRSGEFNDYPDPPITRQIDSAPIDAMRSTGIRFLTTTARYVDKANSYADYGSYFRPTAGAARTHEPRVVSADTSVYVWSVSSMDYELTYVRDDQDLRWSTILNGIDDGGIQYDTALFIEAGQKTDNTSGSMTLWDHRTVQPVNQWNWRMATDYFGLNLLWQEGDTTITLEIRHNSDRSGFARYRRANFLRLDVTWDTTQSAGSYRAWNAEGQAVGAGHWH